MTPTWVLDILAAVMLAVAAISAMRLMLARRSGAAPGDADVDVAHLLMGVAMAGSLVAALTTLPDDAWEVVFGVLTAWFAWCFYRESREQGARVLVDGHRAPHLVHSAAMVYMFVAVGATAAAGSGMGGMGSSSGAMPTLNAPVVAFIFTLLLAGYVVLGLDRLTGAAAHGHSVASLAAVPAGGALAGAAGPAGLLHASVAAAAPAAAVPGSGGQATARVGQASASHAPAGEATGAARLDAGRVHAAGTPLDTVRDLVLAPKMAAVCGIAMGITMAFMLVIMI